MNLANPAEQAKAKTLALDAYVKWKIEQLTPKARAWAEEGCDLAEIQRRIEAFKGEVFSEAERVLRLITIEGLKDGACSG